MTKDSVKKYTLYRLRFWIGYGFLAALVLGILTFAALYVPGGLTETERASVLKSASLDVAKPASLLVTDLPYHALQKLSIELFGLSSFSAKLPSLLIGFASAVAIVLVLARRFSQTAGIITSGIVVVSSLFISLSTTATPAIMSVFWPILLLLALVYGAHKHGVRTINIYLASIVAALSLFTPFSVYVLAAFMIGCALHPHARYLMRKTSTAALTLGAMVVAAVAAVCAYASYRDPEVIMRLVVKSDSFSLNILDNLGLVAMQIVDFSSASTASTGMLAPVFGLSSLAFIVIGMYQMYKWRHAVLSYVLFTWLILTTTLIVFNPSAMYLLVVPFVLLIASGVRYVLNYWYRLFPRNPYARVFALVPVTTLFACIILSSTVQYFYGFHYYAPLANRSVDDLRLLGTELDKHPGAELFVAPSEEPFYQLYLSTNQMDNAVVVESCGVCDNFVPLPDKTTWIATTKSLHQKIPQNPSYIVADSALHRASDRFYVYTQDEK